VKLFFVFDVFSFVSEVGTMPCGKADGVRVVFNIRLPVNGSNSTMLARSPGRRC